MKLTFWSLAVCLAEIGEPLPERTETEGGKAGQSSFRQIMGMKVIHLMSVFILVYVGVEVTFGGVFLQLQDLWSG